MTPGDVQQSETLVNMDVANCTVLTDRMAQDDHERIMNAYHATARRVVGDRRGDVWREEGDRVIAVFPLPRDAIMAMIAMLQDLRELDKDPVLSKMLFLPRIGVAINREGPIGGIPEGQRTNVSRKAINEAAHLEKACPPGRIAISQE